MYSRRSFVFPIAAICILLGTAFSYIFVPQALAQTADPCSASTAGKTHAELQADLDACTADIQKWNDILASTQKNTASYATEVKTLTAKINAAQASINAKSVAIATLGKNITQKQTQINKLSDQIDADRSSLAVLLRKTHELDSYTLADAMLSKKDLSEFFVDTDAYASTQEALQTVQNQLKDNKTQTEAQKADLDKQRQAQADAKAAIEQTKAQVQASKAEQDSLLAQSKNEEKAYGQVLADKKAKAAQIRSALFPLTGVDSQIQFSTALVYATAAGRATGVRPALILAILQQESNLGANVGTCVITNLTTGETKSVNSGKVFLNGIHPTRDLPLLQSIVTGLGRDPLTTRVSCPIGGGYGGAMGPTQFIPSTWKIIAGKVASALGKSLPDPWNPQDAIYATAYMLQGDGAALQTYSDERNAACKYYSGRSCAAGPGATYGTQVMTKAASIQSDIDLLQSV